MRKIILNKCPVCGSRRIEDYLDTDLTSFFFPVPDNIIEKIGKEKIILKICGECSHIFQSEIKMDLIELIYNEFYMHYNLDTSNEFQDVYRERTIEFMKKELPQENGLNALDIGCGEGTYFPFFESMGCKCFGIEPSGKAKIAKERNPNAIISDEYFEKSETNIFSIKFDIILMNWALEHIVEIESFFKKLNQYLKTNTKLIIQVPDVQYYIDNNLALFYVHEHINYFTIETLGLLLEKKGFKIIGKKCGDCPSILICGDYTGNESKEDVYFSEQLRIKKEFIRENNILKEKICNTLSASKKVVLYGMGLLAFWIGDSCLDNVDPDKIELIDDNEFYYGKVVPLFNKRLKTFPHGYDMDESLIVICTSPVYHRRIRNIIRKKFVGNYQIATIDNKEIVIE